MITAQKQKVSNLPHNKITAISSLGLLPSLNSTAIPFSPRRIPSAAESLPPSSGRSSEKLSLPQSFSCYESELLLLHSQFQSSFFHEQAKMSFTSVSDFGFDRVAYFPEQLADLLSDVACLLPSGLRCDVTRSLILLVNRKVISHFNSIKFGFLFC
ncbi:hypothetical protein Lalb_Chr05g0228661 [Lupinus albus]|uniref:Uncharacterized protein n=1 Tax=Lupinus albus TaxID=3870 RepID=A0A6A4QNB3_LUPAL|nr:hypothetical protein Lalb_Chr05g0228661 [Lupinus albus]